MSLQILGYRVLIRPDKVEKQSDGGIVLVRDERRALAEIHTGVVVQIGELAWADLTKSEKQWAKVGDRVLFSKYGSKTIFDPDTEERFEVVNDDDVMCVIREEAKSK